MKRLSEKTESPAAPAPAAEAPAPVAPAAPEAEDPALDREALLKECKGTWRRGPGENPDYDVSEAGRGSPGESPGSHQRPEEKAPWNKKWKRRRNPIPRNP